MTESLWESASRDAVAEHADLLHAQARLAAAPLWPFLAASRTREEYGIRLDLSRESLRARVAEAVGEDVAPAVLPEVERTLAEDFATLVESRKTAAPELLEPKKVKPFEVEGPEPYEARPERPLEVAGPEVPTAASPAEPAPLEDVLLPEADTRAVDGRADTLADLSRQLQPELAPRRRAVLADLTDAELDDAEALLAAQDLGVPPAKASAKTPNETAWRNTRDLKPGDVIVHPKTKKQVTVKKEPEYSPRGGGRTYVEFEDETNHTVSGNDSKVEVVQRAAAKTAQTLEQAIQVAKSHIPIKQQSVAPEHLTGFTIVRGSDGYHHVYDENAWHKPSSTPMLPWSPPTGTPVAKVDIDGKVTRLASLDPKSQVEVEGRKVASEPGDRESADFKTCPKCGSDSVSHLGDDGKQPRCADCGYHVPLKESESATVAAADPDYSGGWARKHSDGGVEHWGREQHGDTGEVIHLYRGKGNKARFYDEDGKQVGPEHANVAPALAWAHSSGYHSPELAAAGIFPDRKSGAREEADVAAIRQQLRQLSGHEARLTYTTDRGVHTVSGRLSYAGDVATVTSAQGRVSSAPASAALLVEAAHDARLAARVAAKVGEVAQGLLATSPRLDVREARRVAVRTVRAYPQMVSGGTREAVLRALASDDDRPCTEADERGGQCAYAAGHQGAHRFEGGNEFGRHEDSVRQFERERREQGKPLPHNLR